MQLQTSSMSSAPYDLLKDPRNQKPDMLKPLATQV
jgi:hypothetical protein